MKIYMCNACEKDHESKYDAAMCCPDIVEKEAYKTKSGKLKPKPHKE